MPLSSVPASTQSDGRWKIIWLPATATNPLSVATLTGGTAKDVTYSFTPSGFNYGISQDTVNDPRLTLQQILSRPGKKTESLEVQYVRSTDANAAKQVLTEGLDGIFVIRRGVDNATALTVGDKVDVLRITHGVQRPDAPTENGVDTITQGMFFRDTSSFDQALVA